MSKTMTMPKIGVNMVEATILEWLVKEGDPVQEGDLILSAETDKAVQEIPASMSGTIGKILAAPGDLVKCQEPIAIILEAGETLDEEQGAAATAKAADKKSAAESSPVRMPDHAEHRIVDKIAIPRMKERIRVSPLAKKIARLNNVDLSAVNPEKPGNRIVKADVLRFLSGSSDGTAVSRAAADKTIPVTGTRRVIAERLSQSARSAVRSVLFLSADAEKLVEWRRDVKEKGGSVSYNDLLTVLVSKALEKFPIMNSRWTDNGIELIGEHNIGIAVDTEKGLSVPVVRGVNRKSLGAVAEEAAEKIGRAQKGELKPEDISGGTFTISNLGMYDVELFMPVINPPECAILGVGSIKREPVASENSNEIEIRAVMGLSLAFDHRIVDGAPAARFLQTVKQYIEQPLRVLW